MDDTISRQAAIDATWEEPTYTDPINVLTEVRDRIKALPSAQPDNSCYGCRYDNADDGVIVPCGYCKRNHPDNYERRTDG